MTCSQEHRITAVATNKTQRRISRRTRRVPKVALRKEKKSDECRLSSNKWGKSKPKDKETLTDGRGDG